MRGESPFQRQQETKASFLLSFHASNILYYFPIPAHIAFEYPIRTVSNFFENSRVKVHHRYQRHLCHRCQRHRRQILPPVLLVLFITVANLPPVSTIPAAVTGSRML